MNSSRVEENALAQCRFTRVDMSRYTDISDARSGNHDICPNFNYLTVNLAQSSTNATTKLPSEKLRSD